MAAFPASRGGAVCSITRGPVRFGLRPRGPVRKVEQNCAEADSDFERSEVVRWGAAGMLRAPSLAMNSRRWYALGVMLCAVFLADRKSTRLNSSHSSISYAVFCLKKKT